MFLNIQPDDSILIVAPHPDDETIGTGGLLLGYASQCDVLLLSDGRRGHVKNCPLTEDEVAERREKEFIAVMQKLGVRSYRLLRIPDHKIRWNFLEILKAGVGRYTHVFVPCRIDAHKDHRAAYRAFSFLTFFMHNRPKLCEYEVWTPLPHYNALLDISDNIQQKRDLMKLYPSQMECMDYEGMLSGLNRYRGACVNKKACEAYFVHEGFSRTIKEKFLKEYRRHFRKK